MLNKISKLEGATRLRKEEQKSINGGFDPICPQFRACWSDRDCPCGGCGVTVNGFYIPDLCAF